MGGNFLLVCENFVVEAFIELLQRTFLLNDMNKALLVNLTLDALSWDLIYWFLDTTSANITSTTYNLKLTFRIVFHSLL